MPISPAPKPKATLIWQQDIARIIRNAEGDLVLEKAVGTDSLGTPMWYPVHLPVAHRIAEDSTAIIILVAALARMVEADDK